MWGELLQTEGDAFLFVIEVDDNDVDLLVESYNLVWIAYASPREVRDVDESVYAAEIDEYSVGGDILNGSLKNLTFLKATDDFFLLCFKLSLDKSFV